MSRELSALTKANREHFKGRQKNKAMPKMRHISAYRPLSSSSLSSSSLHKTVPIKKMIHPGAYRHHVETVITKPTRVTLSSTKTKTTIKSKVDSIIIYSNRDDDVDACVSCYEKINDTMKKKLNLTAVNTKSKGIKYYWCDVCNEYVNVGTGKESKLQVILKLFKEGITDASQLVKQSKSYKWPFKGPMHPELIRGGIPKALATSICELLQEFITRKKST